MTILRAAEVALYTALILTVASPAMAECESMDFAFYCAVKTGDPPQRVCTTIVSFGRDICTPEQAGDLADAVYHACQNELGPRAASRLFRGRSESTVSDPFGRARAEQAGLCETFK
jgi:hypothetical protein